MMFSSGVAGREQEKTDLPDQWFRVDAEFVFPQATHPFLLVCITIIQVKFYNFVICLSLIFSSMLYFSIHGFKSFTMVTFNLLFVFTFN